MFGDNYLKEWSSRKFKLLWVNMEPWDSGKTENSRALMKWQFTNLISAN